MQRTMSAAASPATSAARAGVVSGLNAIPTPRPCARACSATRAGSDEHLDVERDRVGPGRGELLDVVRRVVDHQVAVEPAPRLVDSPRDRAEHDRPHRHRRHEVPVAAVEVEDAAPRRQQRVDLFAEPAEVGRIERRLHLHAVADPFRPAHAWILRAADRDVGDTRGA